MTTLREAVDHCPNLIDLHRSCPQRYPFLLESTSRSGPGRFDILLAWSGEFLELAADGILRGRRGRRAGFLHNLDEWWSDLAAHPDPDPDLAAIPFTGGWFLYLAYELAGRIEPSLSLKNPDDGMPIALAARTPAAFVRDHGKGVTWIVGEAGAEGLVGQMREDANVSGTAEPGNVRSAAGSSTASESPSEDFLAAVNRIDEYIHAGDVFQVNLSRRWELQRQLDPIDLYRRLSQTNPAPFAGLAQWNGAAIVSSSPERLISVRDEIIQTRPIAGTRPRGKNDADDHDLSDELLRHPKEQAEHVMLIDLERNDLGRICEPGTVQVDELMVLESYAHVHHIVSNIRGRLRPGIRPGQCIAATFPGGTITGCPKIRCMEIISELEAEPRGVYTGSMGYLNRDGSMDLNILIRTFAWQPDRLTFRAGAGIVTDSVAQSELEETRSKARGLLEALK